MKDRNNIGAPGFNGVNNTIDKGQIVIEPVGLVEPEPHGNFVGIYFSGKICFKIRHSLHIRMVDTLIRQINGRLTRKVGFEKQIMEIDQELMIIKMTATTQTALDGIPFRGAEIRGMITCGQHGILITAGGLDVEIWPAVFAVTT